MEYLALFGWAVILLVSILVWACTFLCWFFQSSFGGKQDYLTWFLFVVSIGLSALVYINAPFGVHWR